MNFIKKIFGIKELEPLKEEKEELTDLSQFITGEESFADQLH